MELVPNSQHKSVLQLKSQDDGNLHKETVPLDRSIGAWVRLLEAYTVSRVSLPYNLRKSIHSALQESSPSIVSGYDLHRWERFRIGIGNNGSAPLPKSHY